IWLWGLGRAPSVTSFAREYGPRGAIVSAVDLVRGTGMLIGWQRMDAPGATGYLDTDYASKGRTGIAALKEHDLVCVHVEAPDELRRGSGRGLGRRVRPRLEADALVSGALGRNVGSPSRDPLLVHCAPALRGTVDKRGRPTLPVLPSTPSPRYRRGPLARP